MAHLDEKVQDPIHDIYSLDDVAGVDHVYHVKARLLNNAIQEIGMGKYQVRPPLYETHQSILIRRLHVVDALHSCRLRMVR